MDSKKRYEAFLKIVREAEFAWNVEPEDLDVCAAFLKARAEVKRQMRKSVQTAVDMSGYPLPGREAEDVA